MPARMLRMTSRDIEALLTRFGFQLISQKGSHRKWRHPQLRLQVIVPQHGGQQIPIGTSRSIMQAAQIPESEWRK
jgi:predicted RNA binding protein YcfA (HicA-like mRNA interferase family)